MTLLIALEPHNQALHRMAACDGAQQFEGEGRAAIGELIRWRPGFALLALSQTRDVRIEETPPETCRSYPERWPKQPLGCVSIRSLGPFIIKVVNSNIVNRFGLMAVVFSARLLFAQDALSVSSVPAYPPNAQWWGEARFGLFVHWGPVSLKGTEIGWSRDPGPNGARGGSVPAAEYDALYQRFNPTNFDAKQWVAVAKAAGMKYLVFTTKHHDGFCEFDSQLTDYKITNPGSPFHRDVVKELSEACRAGDLRFGMYYSQPDEHHPDYRTSNHKRYQAYLQGQIRELLTGYGQVSVLWFDGLGGTAQDWNSQILIPMIRQLQPGILINDRCGVPADFDTPEQRIGKFQIGRPWESCITICQQWAWKPNDELKSLKQCLDTLIRCSGGDGNLLLNVGPMPDGRIEPRQEARLKELGAWLGKYGDSIYGTRGGPWHPSSTVASTRKENTIFVHVLRWTDDAVVLPKPAMKIISAALLTGGSVKLQQDAATISLSVAPEARRDLDTIVKLTVEGSALQIAPLPGAANVQSYKVTASNVCHHSEDLSPEKAVDGDRETRWATDERTRAAWLEVELGRTTNFSRIGIDEWAHAIGSGCLSCRQALLHHTSYEHTTGPGFTTR